MASNVWDELSNLEFSQQYNARRVLPSVRTPALSAAAVELLPLFGCEPSARASVYDALRKNEFKMPDEATWRSWAAALQTGGSLRTVHDEATLLDCVLRRRDPQPWVVYDGVRYGQLDEPELYLEFKRLGWGRWQVEQVQESFKWTTTREEPDLKTLLPHYKALFSAAANRVLWRRRIGNFHSALALAEAEKDAKVRELMLERLVDAVKGAVPDYQDDVLRLVALHPSATRTIQELAFPDMEPDTVALLAQESFAPPSSSVRAPSSWVAVLRRVLPDFERRSLRQIAIRGNVCQQPRQVDKPPAFMFTTVCSLYLLTQLVQPQIHLANKFSYWRHFYLQTRRRLRGDDPLARLPVQAEVPVMRLVSLCVNTSQLGAVEALLVFRSEPRNQIILALARFSDEVIAEVQYALRKWVQQGWEFLVGMGPENKQPCFSKLPVLALMFASERLLYSEDKAREVALSLLGLVRAWFRVFKASVPRSDAAYQAEVTDALERFAHAAVSLSGVPLEAATWAPPRDGAKFSVQPYTTPTQFQFPDAPNYERGDIMRAVPTPDARRFVGLSSTTQRRQRFTFLQAQMLFNPFILNRLGNDAVVIPLTGLQYVVPEENRYALKSCSSRTGFPAERFKGASEEDLAPAAFSVVYKFHNSEELTFRETCAAFGAVCPPAIAARAAVSDQPAPPHPTAHEMRWILHPNVRAVLVRVKNGGLWVLRRDHRGVVPEQAAQALQTVAEQMAEQYRGPFRSLRALNLQLKYYTRRRAGKRIVIDNFAVSEA